LLQHAHAARVNQSFRSTIFLLPKWLNC